MKINNEARVLLIDDLEKWLDSAEKNLGYLRFDKANITRAYTPQEGIESYMVGQHDLVISDINFSNDPCDIQTNQGNMDGLKVVCPEINRIRQAKRLETKLVVFSSCQPRQLYEEAARVVGADGYIDKKNLVKDIENCLRKLGYKVPLRDDEGFELVYDSFPGGHGRWIRARDLQ